MANRSLVQRLYVEPPLYELARLVGYSNIPLPEGQEKIAALCKQYGDEVMASASEEIVRIDDSTDPPTARLKDEVRKLCFQLLGPAPESPALDRMNGSKMQQGPSQATPAKSSVKPAPKEKSAGLHEHAQGLDCQQLADMLLLARMTHYNHSKRSFASKQAKKEIEAAEAEMRRRDMDISPEETQAAAQ